MPEGITCDICNKPLIIDEEKIDPYFVIEGYGRGNVCTKLDRGIRQFKMRLCTECTEKVLLEPMDQAEVEFKEKLEDGTE